MRQREPPMAIQPIDLQTLFTQIDKVGRNQAQMREGLQLQASLQQVESQKKAEEHVQSVNEAQDMGFGTAQIKDENSHTGQHEHEAKYEDKTEEEEPLPKNAFFRDPALGRNIDISG